MRSSVTFENVGLRVDCAEGESVLDAARRSGAPVASACGGRATCGLCRVRVVAGEAHLSAQNASERRHLGNVYFIDKVRLSCQARLLGGEITVEIVGLAAPLGSAAPAGGGRTGAG